MATSTGMSAPPTTKIAFSEGDPAVLTVYFLAFGFWTAAAGNDFISSTWRSVRETRRRGKAHVVCVFIPMIYICVYAYFQHKNEDYKEMGAALLALLFAMLHLARTFMGLLQLHMFKQWTISAIKSMESLGYKTRLAEKKGTVDASTLESGSDEDDDDTVPDRSDSREGRAHGDSGDSGRGSNKWFSAFLYWICSMTFCVEEKDRIKNIADDILVNDTLLDNRLSDVHTVCMFRFFSKAEKRNMRRAKSSFYRWWLCFRYGLRNSLRGIPILFSLTFLKTPRVRNVDSAPRLVPKHPESIWLHWATALVAQAGWMLDEFGHTGPYPSAEDKEGRIHFAEQILLSAALHTQREGKAAASADAGIRSQDSSIISDFLGFQDWHKYPKLCSGQFSKQEFLERACRTGKGLPYDARHSKAMEVKGGVKQCGYSNFQSELFRARETLPPEIETRVKNFDVEQLEWFTVFVSIKNWTPRSSAQETVGDVEGNAAISAEDLRSASRSESPTEFEGAVHERDIPIQNLKTQLGIEKLSDLTLENSKLPFLRHTFEANLWGNRNVLEASCHIDNWISVITGEETSEILQQSPEVEQAWFSERAFDSSWSRDRGDGILDKIIQASDQLERKFSEHREFLYMPVTFAGCSMEMLRSSLAKWAEKNKGGDEGSWKPSLLPTDAGKSKILDPFTASADFTTCLRSLRSFSLMSKRFVKMRVLWELQNHFQTHLPREGVAPSSGEAMALCILSFPAVSVDAIRMERKEAYFVNLKHGDEKILQIADYGYSIRASLGPQDLKLCVSFKGHDDNSKVEISLHICDIGACVTRFDWEAWRNAFYGRLEARRRWKERFDTPHFSLIPPTFCITFGTQKVSGSKNAVIPRNRAGADISVWRGWLPHCSSICMFELASEGFILQPGTCEHAFLPYPVSEGVTLEYSISRETWVPVEYTEANTVWLKNASLVADDLLQVNFGCQGHRKEQSALERAEMFLRRNSDTDADLALQLIHVSAVHERDSEALERAIAILLCKERGLEAVKLLEEFYAYGKHGEGEPEESSEVYSFFRNEKFVNDVIFLFEQILKATKLGIYKTGAESHKKSCIHKRAVHSYQMFLLLSITYGGPMTGTVELLSRSIDQGEVGNAKICFAFLLQKGRNGMRKDLPRAIELYERGIKRGNLYAMYNLAVMLSNGEEGAEQDLHRAMELFDTLVHDHRNVNAMIRLADMLLQGGDGFPKNLPRAMELYTKAVDEGLSVEARKKLACVLRIGQAGFHKDMQQAA